MEEKIISESELEEFQQSAEEAIDNLFVDDGVEDKGDEPSIEESYGLLEEDAAESKPAASEKTDEHEDSPFIGEVSISDRLARLQEYILSLDWEVTTPNIFKLMNEFKVIKKLIPDDRNIKTIIIMAIGVLNYVKDVKTSVKPIALQFLHLATDTLVELGQEGGVSEKKQKAMMSEILNTYSRLPADVKKYSKIVVKKKPKQVTPSTSPSMPSSPQESRAVSAQDDNLTIKLLFEKIERIEGDFKRFEQNVNTTLNSIREDLDALCKKVASLEEGSAEAISAPASTEDISTNETMTLTDLSESLLQTPLFNSIAVLTIGDEKIAVEQGLIANVFPLSSSKIAKLKALKYLRVSDFVSFFASVNKGMRGPLAQIDKRVLKSIFFTNLNLEGIIKAEPPVDSLTTLVLLARGDFHGALFVSAIHENVSFEPDSYKPVTDIKGVKCNVVPKGEESPIRVIDPSVFA